MKIRFQFQGGQARYGTDCVNYISIHPSDINAVIEMFGDDADELYEEYVLDESSSECAGYDEMVDKLANKLCDMEFDLRNVEWFYGSEVDGAPKHIGE